MRINLRKNKRLVWIAVFLLLLLAFTAACGNETAVSNDNAASANSTQTAKLSISGSGVVAEKSFTVDDLKAMSKGFFSGDVFALNSYGTKAYFNFQGVNFWYLLDDAVGLKDGASKVTVTGEDGYTVELSIEQAARQDYIDEQNPDAKYPVIIVWQENSVDYDPADGSPFRLVLGQAKAGDVNKPNWVSNIATIVVE